VETNPKSKEPAAVRTDQPPAPTGNVLLALAVLALQGHANFTGWCEAARAAGVSASGQRALSTLTLRRAVAPYVDAGWVLERRDGFQLAFGLGPRLLRSLSAQALASLNDEYKNHFYRFESYSRGSTGGKLGVRLKLGLAGGDTEWEAALGQLLSASGPLLVAAHQLQEPLRGAFERAWFERFSAERQRQFAELVLDFAEATGVHLLRFASYAADPTGLVQTDSELRQRWARFQLLLGGAGSISEQAAAQLPPAGGVELLRRVVAGSYAEARVWLDGAFGGKREPLLAGAAGVCQVLLRLSSGAPGALAEALRLANAGARKGSIFRESHATLKRLLGILITGQGTWIEVMRPRASEQDDVLFEIVQGLCVLWFKELEVDVPYVLGAVEQARFRLQPQGATWLSEQLRDLQLALESRLSAEKRAQLEAGDRPVFAEHTAPSLLNPSHALSPLRALMVEKPPWEAALSRLEGLAAKETAAEQPASSERIVWRVIGTHTIDPYLQRATTSGWTRGRRLAIKHLLPGSEQRATLPPEDLRVAEHAHESVSHSYGYREVSYALDGDAWDALVGHPRVFEGDSDMPIEVARGTLHLVAFSEGAHFCLKMDPSDLGQHRVRREGERLVVYAVGKATQRVIDAVGAGLAVPAAERERLLAAAARLTHLVPLLSSEPSAGHAHPGDSTPYLRLTPRASGMTVTLIVRPLGQRGPASAPGLGSPSILARVDGESQQANRDLSAEARNAAEVIAACPVLDGRQIADSEWFLESADACLDLLTCSAALGEKVRVEWPQGQALKLLGRLERSSMRGSVRRVGTSFLLDARLTLEGELELSLHELLALLPEQHGRFVRLAQGDFVELSAELREQLAAIASARSEKAEGAPNSVVLPPTALSALDGLLARDSRLVPDAGAVKWRDEFAKVFDGKPRLPRGLTAELRDYQLDGFRWLARLAELGFGACLADDMGLGKTVQLIALLLHRGRSGPQLVLAPTSVIENWLRELARFAPSLTARAYAGSDRERLLEGLGPRDVLVTGYATLQQDAAKLQALTWSTVIADEAQFIKNAGAQRTRAALGLNAGMRVAATGTPVENHAEDLHSLFQFAQPGLLGTMASFRRRFPLDPESAAGRESRRRLRQLVQPFLLRRTKAQVLAELPAVTEIEHHVELSAKEAALYEAVRRSALEKLDGPGDAPKNKFAVLAELTRLRRLCCDARLVAPEAEIESSKLRAFGELMRELVAAGHRALVFSQFVDVLKLAAETLTAQGATHQYLDGSCTQKQRSAAIDAFQAGEGDAFLISLKAGGFGLNLTAADYVIHLDPWWNPAAEAQATDRAHRIGQEKPVTVYRLVAKGTIEERIVALHRTKRELADSLLAGSDQAATLSSSELRSLLEG
jgi:SNF2-related domain/Helicase conserved C-terminal domain